MPDIKAFYGTPADAVITLAGLASDANLLIGRQSAEVDNTVLRALDYLISGKITTGTSPTGGTIEVWAIASFDNIGLYPDTVTNAGDLSRTLSTGPKPGFVRLVAAIAPTTTSNVVYPFAPISLASLFGSVVCPPRFVLFVTHSSGAALNATGTNHQIRIQPIYETVG